MTPKAIGEVEVRIRASALVTVLKIHGDRVHLALDDDPAPDVLREGDSIEVVMNLRRTVRLAPDADGAA